MEGKFVVIPIRVFIDSYMTFFWKEFESFSPYIKSNTVETQGVAFAFFFFKTKMQFKENKAQFKENKAQFKAMVWNTCFGPWLGRFLRLGAVFLGVETVFLLCLFFLWTNRGHLWWRLSQQDIWWMQNLKWKRSQWMWLPGLCAWTRNKASAHHRRLAQGCCFPPVCLRSTLLQTKFPWPLETFKGSPPPHSFHCF